MYAQYTYLNTATIQQIYDDIFEIFCGETTVSNLSASCDQTNTIIRTTYSTSPWVDYDSATGDAAERIMRMEMDDDAGVYKTVGWHHDGVDDLAFSIMASWDTGTNVATSEVVENYDKEGIRTYPTAGGVVHIYSSQYCTVIMEQDTLSDVWGSQCGDPTYGSLGIFECTRDHPSMAVTDMPNWFISSTAMFWGDSDATMTATFWKGRDETDTVITPMTAEMGYQGRDNMYSDSNSYAITGIGGTTALEEIGDDTQFYLETIVVGGSNSVATYDCTTYYGDVSSRCDIWMMPPSTQNVGDLVHIGANAYIVFKAGYTAATTGTIIGGKFIVPYG